MIPKIVFQNCFFEINYSLNLEGGWFDKWQNLEGGWYDKWKGFDWNENWKKIGAVSGRPWADWGLRVEYWWERWVINDDAVAADITTCFSLPPLSFPTFSLHLISLLSFHISHFTNQHSRLFTLHSSLFTLHLMFVWTLEKFRGKATIRKL